MKYLIKNIFDNSTIGFDSLKEIAIYFNISISQVSSYISRAKAINGYIIKKNGLDGYKQKKEGKVQLEIFGKSILNVIFTDRTEDAFDSNEVIKMLKDELNELRQKDSRLIKYIVDIEMPEKIQKGKSFKYRVSIMAKMKDISDLFEYGNTSVVPLMEKIIFFVKTSENDS